MPTLLLIDDSSDVQRLFQIAFKNKLGYEVVSANNGEAGLELAQRSPVDVIVLDVMMPGMDGYSVARQLRQNPKTKDVPIIMFTARAQPTDKAAALEAGADAVLSKLASLDDVMATIKEVSKNKTAVPTASGQVIGVLGCRGGVGATTLALNVAASYVRRGQRACVLDLVPISGHAALMLRLPPKPSWDDLSGTISVDTVQPLLRQHASGLHLLAAPSQPPRSEISNQAFTRLSQTLASAFNVVVINCSPALDTTSRAAVAAASRLLLVTSPEVTAVQAAAGMMSYLGSVPVPADRLRVVLNHSAKDMSLPPANVAKALGHALDAVLPFDESQTNALAQGIPLVFLAKSAPLPPYVFGLASLLQKM